MVSGRVLSIETLIMLIPSNSEMKTLFVNNKLNGFSIFSSPKNWQRLLSNLSTKSSFFFVFSEEKGSHLNVYFPNTQQNNFLVIENYLKGFVKNNEYNYSETVEDLLFKNFDENAVIPINLIENTNDLAYKPQINDEFFIEFLTKFSRILTAALCYNDFFLKPKNRLNFGLQLVLMASVNADSKAIVREIQRGLHDEFFSGVFENNKEEFLNLYHELLQIEHGDDTEKWVIDWVKLSKNFLNISSFVFLIDVVCYVLNINLYKKQLLFLVKETLNSSRL